MRSRSLAPKRRDAAYPRIEPLGDALEDAPLPAEIAPLENHHYLELWSCTQVCNFTSSPAGGTIPEVDPDRSVSSAVWSVKFIGQRIETSSSIQVPVPLETIQHFRRMRSWMVSFGAFWSWRTHCRAVGFACV